MKDYTPNKFQQAVDLLCAMNWETQKQMIESGVQGSLGNYYFVTECCTVSINAGRRTGKSVWAEEHATDKGTVVVASRDALRQFGSVARNGGLLLTAEDFFQPTDSEKIVTRLRGWEVTRVIIDEPRHLVRRGNPRIQNSRALQLVIFDVLKLNLRPPYQFVLLGE